MTRRRLFRSSAFLATSIASFLPHGSLKAEESALVKKLRESVLSGPNITSLVTIAPPAAPPTTAPCYPWKTGIVTTTFWIGERPAKEQSRTEPRELVGSEMG